MSYSSPSVTPVEPPLQKPLLDSLPRMAAPVQLPKSLESMSITGGGSGYTPVAAAAVAPFDMCREVDRKCSVKLNCSLVEINKEKRRQRELSRAAHCLHLRLGMVLLNFFLKPDVQIEIVKVCQRLGVSAGGFYRPGYSDEAQLNLQIMCLGKNWDPNTSSYGDIRPSDGAKPPTIPATLKTFVKAAIEASHGFLGKRSGTSNLLVEVPPMLPNIYSVNFYSNSGKLGLHQDKDESKGSLMKQLPVVSFSRGDTAEFLYGDQRDDDKRPAFHPAVAGSRRDDSKLSKIDLESGDVIIRWPIKTAYSTGFPASNLKLHRRVEALTWQYELHIRQY